MGVPWEDCPVVGQLIGIKIFANEFIAYLRLTSIGDKLHVGDHSFQLSTVGAPELMYAQPMLNFKASLPKNKGCPNSDIGIGHLMISIRAERWHL